MMTSSVRCSRVERGGYFIQTRNSELRYVETSAQVEACVDLIWQPCLHFAGTGKPFFVRLWTCLQIKSSPCL